LTIKRQLIVNADDFGFTPDVNEGIVEAHRSGILTATTLMANGAAFDDAVRLARETPTLDIGAHLVLIGGASTLTGREFPPTVTRLLAAMAKRELRIHDELRAQMERILKAGVRLTHIDTHKHTHLAPQVLDAVARLAEEFDVRWVRRPFDFPGNPLPVPPLKRLTSLALWLLRPRLSLALARHGCKTTDHFAGFQITGRFRAPELVTLLAALPEGITELMCHPGRCREPLRNARTRLKESREHELAALTAVEVRQAVERNGIMLTNYSRQS
jgi:chitin disaccharide deacetylase